ncbi:MAG: VWA domain-containing protein [Dehalococcoidia bacterium]
MTPNDDDQSALQRVLEQLATRHGALGANLVQFAALLKAGEVDVTTTQLLGAARSVDVIDVARRDDFRQALAANLLTRVEDRAVFDVLFDRFWRLPRDEEDDPTRPEPPRLAGGETRLGTAEIVNIAYAREDAGGAPPSETPPRTYSGEDALLRKDFATFRDDEVREARRYLRRLAPKLATATTRRRRSASSGAEIDLRRSLRLAARRGGEVLRLAYRRRKVRRLRLVLLCDVSGSMDVYSRFMAQFLFGLQTELRGVSTFVFSTRLYEVTPMLRARTFDEALAMVGRQVEGWSGGTRIGACLADFNRRYAKERLGPRTVVVVISDGWDRGDVAQLRREMAALRRRAFRVLWLNPLLGADDYRPVAQGMAAALPYVDEFLPVHNLESLARVGRTLVKLARG